MPLLQCWVLLSSDLRMAPPVFLTLSLDSQGLGPSLLIFVAPVHREEPGHQRTTFRITTRGPRLQDMQLILLGSQTPPPSICTLSQLKAGGINIPPTVKLEKPTSLILSGDFFKWLSTFNSNQSLYFLFIGSPWVTISFL